LVAGVTPNQSPVAEANGPYSGAIGSSITFNATGSYDPDGSIVSFEWDWNNDGIYDEMTTSSTITHTWGTTYSGTVGLKVTDNEGLVAYDTATVDVTDVDRIPPSITSLTTTPSILWPPNHKMVAVTTSISVSDNLDPSPFCRISSVSSNEPQKGLGDGDTAPDWKITGDLTVNLRAERSDEGSGRVYTITVMCTDTFGNSSTGTTNVRVPLD